MGQTGQLTASHRQQRSVISAACQLVEHVEPLPHCLPEHLAQNLIHLAALLPYQPVRDRPHAENVLHTRQHTGPSCASSTYKAWARRKPAKGCAALIGHAMTVNGTN
jgi:hypothetical protein